MHTVRPILLRQMSFMLVELRAKQPTPGSLEFCLANNLQNYFNAVNWASKPSDIRYAARLFSHFCIDSLDYQSATFQKCIKIANTGLKLN